MHKEYLKEIANFHQGNFRITNSEKSIEVNPDFGNNFNIEWGSFITDGFTAKLTVEATGYNPNTYKFVSLLVSTGDYFVEIKDDLAYELFFNRDEKLTSYVYNIYIKILSDNDQGRFPSSIVYKYSNLWKGGNEMLFFASEEYEIRPGMRDFIFSFRSTEKFKENLEFIKEHSPTLHKEIVGEDTGNYQIVDMQKRIYAEFDTFEELERALELGFAFDNYIPYINTGKGYNSNTFDSLDGYFKCCKEDISRPKV